MDKVSYEFAVEVNNGVVTNIGKSSIFQPAIKEQKMVFLEVIEAEDEIIVDGFSKENTLVDAMIEVLKYIDSNIANTDRIKILNIEKCDYASTFDFSTESNINADANYHFEVVINK